MNRFVIGLFVFAFAALFVLFARAIIDNDKLDEQCHKRCMPYHVLHCGSTVGAVCYTDVEGHFERKP